MPARFQDIRLPALFAALPLLVMACSETQTAGSASVTTNGNVSGTVTDSAGEVTEGATAYLILAALDPAQAISSQAIRSQQTDSLGQYLFEDVPAGDYRLLVRSEDSLLAALVELVTIASDTSIALPTEELSTTSTLVFPVGSCHYREGDRIYLPGTDLTITASSADVARGSLDLPGVPHGSVSSAMLLPYGFPTPIPLLRSVQFINKDTVVVACDYEDSVSVPQGFFHGQGPRMGGSGGDTVRVRDTAALRAALSDDVPRIVLVQGSLRGDGSMIPMGSFKTLLGTGEESILDSIGISIRSDSCIVIRNLQFRNGSDDAVSIEESARYIWIDHNTFEHYGDGLVDIKRASDFITVSWNHFLRHKIVSVIGHSDANGAQDSTHLLVTFHHNWFDGVENGAPRVRYGTVHSFNDYHDSSSSYAIASTQFARVFVEASTFEDIKKPTVIGHTSPNPGELAASGNQLIGSGPLLTNGSAFTPSSYYSYHADDVSTVRLDVTLGAGAGKLLSLR